MCVCVNVYEMDTVEHRLSICQLSKLLSKCFIRVDQTWVTFYWSIYYIVLF